MIRTHENPVALRAGALSVLVHGVLLALLLVSFQWKSVKPMNVAEVQLWDSLPAEKPVAPPPPPEPTPEPEVTPEPPKPEPKPEPVVQPKVDIQLKKEKEPKPKLEKPKKEEPPKPDLKKQQELEKKKQDELKKLQQMLLAEDMKPQAAAPKQEGSPKPAQPAVNQGELDKYMAAVSGKIRSYVNKQLCGNGKPELMFEISMLPTGEIIGSPHLTKSSGIAACDDAVDRAIRQSNPLPKPPAELLNMVRDMKLKFRPNDD